MCQKRQKSMIIDDGVVFCDGGVRESGCYGVARIWR